MYSLKDFAAASKRINKDKEELAQERYDSFLYAFFKHGVLLEEFNELPIPYIMKMAEKIKEVENGR